MKRATSFRFIHCADLHLESGFKGLQKRYERWADEMRESTFIAMEKMVELAIKESVDFVVIAGDIFDAETRSIRAEFRFRDAMERLGEHGINCFIVCGNHDPLDSWSKHILLPKNVIRFSTEGESAPAYKDGQKVANVTGISYAETEVMEDLSQKLEPFGDVFDIAVLHCNIGSREHKMYSATTVGELCEKGFDYWALGHVHQRGIIHEDPHIVYPGNTQGRHVNEQGEKGCYLVTVADGKVIDLSFHSLAPFVWETLTVDITDKTSLDQLRASTPPIEQHALSVVKFIGRGPLDNILRSERNAEEMAEEICCSRGSRCVRYLVHTRPDIDLESRRGGNDFLASVLRHADTLAASPDEVRAILKGAPQRFHEWIDEINDEILSEIAQEAAVELFERLLRGEE